MGIVLNRKLVDERVFRAIDIQRSGTCEKELLVSRLEKARNDAEFVQNMNQL